MRAALAAKILAATSPTYVLADPPTVITDDELALLCTKIILLEDGQYGLSFNMIAFLEGLGYVLPD